MTSILLSSNIILGLDILNFFKRLEATLDYYDNKIEIFLNNMNKYFDNKIDNPIIENIEIYEDKNRNVKKFLINHQKNIEYHKNYSKIIEELEKVLMRKNMNLELSPTQEIIAKTLRNKKCIIIYLGLFYDFNKKEWDKQTLLKEIVHTSIKLKIPVVLLGENNPRDFIPLLNNALSVHFSKSNYITPYHYKKRWFDTPIRYENNETSNSPCKVSLNQMIDDIIDEYQLGDEIYKIIKFYDINFG